MSTAHLIRWSGLFSVAAGVLFALATILHPAGADLAAYRSPSWVRAHLLGWVSVMLMQLGLVGLYARQVKEAGRLGLARFVLALIGTAFAAGVQFMESTVLPVVAAEAPAIFVQARTPPPYAVPSWSWDSAWASCCLASRQCARVCCPAGQAWC